MPNYKSRWDNYSFFFAYGLLIPVFLVTLIFSDATAKEWLIVMFSLLGGITVLLLIIYFTTSYQIDDQYLRYRSFIFFGKIKIENINKLEVGKTMYVGMKPAFARHGIIVRYNKYDEIYISPPDNNEFVEELLKINPEIEVVRA